MYTKQKDYIGIYAITNNKELDHLRLLHRFIFNADKNLFVDHKDGNTLNMRKSNLRHCSNEENLKNRKIPITNKSGAKGVYWDTHISTPKWRANIKLHDKTYYLGYYEKFEDAVKARKEAEILLQGEFSRDYATEYIKNIKLKSKLTE